MHIFWEDNGVERSLDLAVERAADLAPVLRKFGRHLRGETKRHFDARGPGWPPLAVGTLERLQQTRVAPVTAQGLLRRSYVRRATQALLVRHKAATENVRAAAAEALGDLRRLQNGGGQVNSALGRRLARQMERQAEAGHFERREGKRAIESHKPLGRLGTSIRAQVEGRTLMVGSSIPWAGVHNEGGTAGNGAQIPARPFLYLRSEDLDVLARLALEHVTEAK